MSVKLSHSAISRYRMCGASYKNHYISKIRPNHTTGALFFGDALDKALNCLLLNEGDPYERFIQAFTHGEINKVSTYLPTSTKIVYANSDYDAELLDETHHQKAREVVAGAESLTFEQVKDKKDSYGFEGLKDVEKSFYNYILWQCLCVKAELILAGYKKKVLPKIKKVIAIQEKIEVGDGEGNYLTGFIDLVADVEGHGVCILDNKTSKIDYEEDAVKSSDQLTQYYHLVKEKFGAKKAGFIVAKKQISKLKECVKCGANGTGSRAKTCDAEVAGQRCHGEWKKVPFATFQVIIDDISEQQENFVMENIDEATSAIKAGVFIKNTTSCDNWYGQKCVYYNYCRNGSMKGLVKNEA